MSSKIYIMKERIKLNNSEDICRNIYVVNAFTLEKADELFYKKIHEDGKIVFDQLSKNYEKECMEYIKMNKLVLMTNLEYCLKF